MLTLPRLQPPATEAYIQEVNERARRAHKPGSVEKPARGRETTWVEVPADEVGEVLMQAWAINGIDYLFFASGSDINWFQEHAVKLRVTGRPTPRIITMLHENTCLNAALGYAAVAQRPGLTAAHIELGVLNYGGAVHSAARGRFPVMMTSGRTPNAYGRDAHGGRDQAALYRGDMADYGEIVRQYVKWDHNLGLTDVPGLMVSRALQLIMSEPYGPGYMSIPRDVAMTGIHGSRFPTVAQLGIAATPSGDAGAIRQAARRLVEAENPLVITQAAGSDPRAFDALVALCELLGLPVTEAGRERANFPTTHSLYEGGPRLGEADVVLTLEAFTPWIPGHDEPSPEATIISVGVDPEFSTAPTYEFPADLRVAGSAASVLTELYEEADRLLTNQRRQAIDERKQRIAAASAARRERLQREALEKQAVLPISPAYAAYCLGQVIEEDAIFLNDVVSSGADVSNHVQTTRPHSTFKSGSAAGGFGSGAAFGAKLAAPEKFVALATGDGFFLYGVPYAALWAAAKYNAPYLTVVFQNKAYSTGTIHIGRHYPEGYSLRENDFEGGEIDPPVDLAKLAEASNAYGQNVSDPEQLLPALKRACQVVREGTPALVAVQVTPLVKHEGQPRGATT
jgi:acetolactate synthase-1/2/3 large subunit